MSFHGSFTLSYGKNYFCWKIVGSFHSTVICGKTSLNWPRKRREREVKWTGLDSMILEVPSNPVILWFCVTYLPLLIAGKHLYSLQAGPQVSHFTITWVSLFYPTPVESMADTSLPSGGHRFIIPSHIFSSPSECNQLKKEQAASPSEGPAESALCSAWIWGYYWPW